MCVLATVVLQIGMMICLSVQHFSSHLGTLCMELYGAVCCKCISHCDVAQSWDLLFRQIVHLTGSRTEGKHAVLCLRSAAF